MTGTYPLQWFSSNTPQQQSLTHCDMARWLGYHAGPHGTGWKRIGTAVPLATGKAFHDGVELIGGWLLDYQRAHGDQSPQALPPDVTAWAAAEAVERYVTVANTRGLLVTATDADPAVNFERERLIAEQACLIEAMLWVYATVRLPAMLASYRLREVEVEETLILDCTCGLGEDLTDYSAHAARQCEGIVQQGKADQLWQHVNRQTLTYEEFKTWGTINASKELQWAHSGQLLVNMEAASRRTGRSVDEAFVTVLLKGWRGRERNAPPTDPKTQHSVLCYGYFDPGNPPFKEADWQAKKDFTDDLGKARKLPASYQKVALWDETNPMPPARAEASRIETWVTQHLRPAQYPDVLRVLGPFPRPLLRVPKAISGIKAEERRFRADVDLLRENNAVMPSDPLVEEVIARSWDCTGYDGTACEFTPICFNEPGWDAPETTGKFERRRPHHATECAAVEALGVLLPAREDGGDDGE